MQPPLPRRPWLVALLVLLLLSPLLVSLAHHGLMPEPAIQVRSHDFGGLQLERVRNALVGGPTPAREGFANLGFWAMDPIGFLRAAYGAEGEGGSAWKLVGWLILGAGLTLSWWRRHPTPRDALSRFISVLLPLQVGMLLLVARDLHHLAQATPVLAIAAGLGADGLAGLRAPPRSLRRTLLAMVLVLPWVFAGAHALVATDPAVRTIAVPTFTEQGQRALVEMLGRADVDRLLVVDYESYGMLELRAPQLRLEHAWAAASVERKGLLEAILRRAAGGHLLVVEASAPMIYNLRPGPRQLAEAAEALGLEVEAVDRLPDGSAILYRVDAKRGEAPQGILPP